MVVLIAFTTVLHAYDYLVSMGSLRGWYGEVSRGSYDAIGEQPAGRKGKKFGTHWDRMVSTTSGSMPGEWRRAPADVDRFAICWASLMIRGQIRFWYPTSTGPMSTTIAWSNEYSNSDVRAEIMFVNYDRNGRLNEYMPVVGWEDQDNPVEDEKRAGIRHSATAASGLMRAGAAVQCSPTDVVDGASRWQAWTKNWSSLEAEEGQRRGQRWDLNRIPFVDKKRRHTPVPARAHWGLYYFVFKVHLLLSCPVPSWLLSRLACQLTALQC